jgi:glycosyltransferase involved in cell wall biosynthesis
MKIAIDGYEANAENRVGIGRFAYEMLVHLYKITQGHQVKVFLPYTPRPDLPPETSRWNYMVARPAKLWTFVGLPLALRHEPFDVIFSPTHYIPRFTSVPRVMAIMDISYLTYPELFRPADLHKLVYWTRYSVRRAAEIITISQYSKRAIIEAYHVPEEKVVVAYPALSGTVKETVMQPSENTLSLPDRYILSVGTLQPRKNFVRLIEAFKDLKDKDIHLVIVGKKGWLYEEILDAPKQFDVQNRVHFLEFVGDTELKQLYGKAVCFVLPSLYEGFGMPVLEAMSYSVPVVVSNTSSLPEVAGEAGIYVDPADSWSIAQGIEKALSESPKDRKIRIATGLDRVKEFTWDKAAKNVMTVLEKVGEKI